MDVKREYYCSKCNTQVKEEDVKCPKCKSLLATDGAVKIKNIKIHSKKKKTDQEIENPFVVNIFVISSVLVLIFNILGILIHTSPIVILFLIPEILFIYKFYNLKKDCLSLYYISRGISIIGLLLTLNIMFIITDLFWIWVVRDYVLNKKINGKKLFK